MRYTWDSESAINLDKRNTFAQNLKSKIIEESNVISGFNS
jgi:hypothetical protein